MKYSMDMFLIRKSNWRVAIINRVLYSETKKDALDILLFHQFGNYVIYHGYSSIIWNSTGYTT